MGGGDLNTKKSWHPHLRKNQERVWKEEQNALEERKLIEKLRKEREEERQIEELQRLAEANGGKVAVKRVDWLYSGPSGDGAAVTEEREGYLLGKRRIDGLLKGNDSQALQKGAAVGIDAVGNGNANSTRDTQKKVLQDPLLMIQKQKMEMQLKAMKDAQKQKQYDEKRAKEKERERKHKHRNGHRDRDRSRSADEDRERRRHHRRDRSRSASNDRDDRERRHRRHRRDDRADSRRRSRSRSPRRRDDDRERRQRSRSRSPYRKSHRDDYRERERDSYRRRDRAPPSREEPEENGHRERDSYRQREPPPPRENIHQQRAQEPTPPPKPDMAARLAEMQVAASSLEEQREERVRLREAEDAATEDKHKNNSDGQKRFIAGFRSKAAEADLGDAISRGRQGFRSSVDA
ncbi:RNA-splicing factor [Didymosphaeria variabile]|uniref:RNA-splicing factor n=1 Tax=Didymosphaeria variabile TaxID=1932322 RepID=A0A9W8XMF2_9PLEO|nr:RNA-splicing factor [Didymosphaeria variabile]KAJ4354655.1 RNA-splicing factor [Didymosphaeria variabile]